MKVQSFQSVIFLIYFFTLQLVSFVDILLLKCLVGRLLRMYYITVLKHNFWIKWFQIFFLYYCLWFIITIPFSFRYSPPPSEVLKFAWIQYIAFFAVISFLLFRINSFVFRHQVCFSLSFFFFDWKYEILVAHVTKECFPLFAFLTQFLFVIIFDWFYPWYYTYFVMEYLYLLTYFYFLFSIFYFSWSTLEQLRI